MPSDIALSAAQAGYQARDVAAARQSASAGSAEAAQRQVKAADDTAATVDTTDRDTAVFTDSEGAGSQGRHDEPAPDDEAGQPPPPPPGITKGPDGKVHIDLEA